MFRTGQHENQKICVSKYQDICYGRRSTFNVENARGASVCRRRSEEKHTWPMPGQLVSPVSRLHPPYRKRTSISISLCQSVATFFAFCAPSYLISYANPMCLDSTSIVLFLISRALPSAKLIFLPQQYSDIKVKGETQHSAESAASTK